MFGILNNFTTWNNVIYMLIIIISSLHCVNNIVLHYNTA